MFLYKAFSFSLSAHVCTLMFYYLEKKKHHYLLWMLLQLSNCILYLGSKMKYQIKALLKRFKEMTAPTADKSR